MSTETRPTEPGQWWLATRIAGGPRQCFFIGLSGGELAVCLPSGGLVTVDDIAEWHGPVATAATLYESIARITTELDEARCKLTNAEADAGILAHAYEHDTRPPPDVVARALAYRAGRPTT